MASAIYVLDDSFEVIISRLYKHELDSYHVLNNFKEHLGSMISNASPILSHDGINYIFLRHHGLIFVSVCLENVDVMLVLQFLYKFIQLLQQYLELEILDKDIIQSNYVLIYELFDEILDYGLPQSTEFSILREFIKPEMPVSETAGDDSSKDNFINYALSRTSTTKISWRPKGIFYKKNEIFIDLVESVSFQYNLQNSEIKKNIIQGELNAKCYLSGMPLCKIGLNELLTSSAFGENSTLESLQADNKIIFDNMNFHQCVELSNLDKNQLQFIPPDGTSKLMNYSIVNLSTTNLKPLLMIEPVYKLFKRKNSYKLHISVDLKTFFKRKYLIKNVEIHIPITYKQQQNASKKLFVNFNKAPKFKTKIGNVVLSLDKSLIIWKIPSVDGNSSSSIFTNISKNVLSEAYQMVSEFELVEEHDLVHMLDQNEYYGKVDNNSLYYEKLVEETELLQKKNNQTQDIIAVNFEIPFLTYSGLKIDFLKIVEDNYHFQSFPWVRYLVKNDDYFFKLGERNFEDNVKYEVEEPLDINEKVVDEEKE